LNQFSEAADDYSRALLIRPSKAWYRDRAWAYLAAGNRSKAFADYDKFLEEQTDENGRALALSARGQAHYLLGEFKDAITDLTAALEVNPYDNVRNLFLAMARMRSGSPDYGALLQEHLKSLNQTNVDRRLALYTGEVTPEQLLAAINDPDPDMVRHRACTYYFYLGEWELGHGHQLVAVDDLKKSVSTCPHTYVEYLPAYLELKRLTPEAPDPGPSNNPKP
jgi:lipoprotein NlpI